MKPTVMTVAEIAALTSAERLTYHNEVAKALHMRAVKRFSTVAVGHSRTIELVMRYGMTGKNRQLDLGREPFVQLTNIAPTGKAPKVLRMRSVQARLVTLLQMDGGVTMEALVNTVGSAEHAIRGLFASRSDSLKAHGYGVRSEMVDGFERFRLVMPKNHPDVPAFQAAKQTGSTGAHLKGVGNV